MNEFSEWKAAEMFAEAGYVFIGFILCISVPVNRVYGSVNVICALKGSSVDLPCSAVHPSSNMKWYTVHRNNSMYVLNEFYADGCNEKHQVTEKSNFTLTIDNLKESDAKFYCCTENKDDQELCWLNRTELRVADLQVMVIPATEDQAVTVMCSTSCPLTENPAAYVWYKNREFLYEDWSPWYQELVSSDEAATYSCAVKGYEDLRAPEVSVDSVTSTCFRVTYAKGRMCFYQQKPVDEPCSITYPRDLHVHITHKKNYVTLTCTSSCLTSGPQTAYRWYWNKELNPYCESQDMVGFHSSYDTVSCAVKGHEDLLSDEVCTDNRGCWSVNYVSRRICALEGSSVNISSKYSIHSFPNSKIWYKIQRRVEVDAESLTEDGRLESDDSTLRINHVTKNDSAEYAFIPETILTDWKHSHLPVVILVVTGLKVTMTPSAVVTEGHRVTLTCTTSCPLTDSTNYIWYMNGRPLTLPDNPTKHLLLDPVGIEHAGNYSCSIPTSQNVSSAEETLTVRARGKSPMIMNAVKLAVLSLLMLTTPVLLCLWMRKKKSYATKSGDKLRAGQVDLLYESISLRPMNAAAQAEPAQLQEDTM